MLGRTQPVEIVVTVIPTRDAHAEVGAATAAVHALLMASALRDRGYRLVAVEGIEPCEAAAGTVVVEAVER